MTVRTTTTPLKSLPLAAAEVDRGVDDDDDDDVLDGVDVVGIIRCRCCCCRRIIRNVCRSDILRMLGWESWREWICGAWLNSMEEVLEI